MDPYDLPDEFSHLQAQDMSKLGFMQDLIRGIKKIVDTASEKHETFANASAAAPAVGVAPLLKRVFMFLEDGSWEEADAYCEKVLDQDPENAQAYLGKLMSELRVKTQEELKNCDQPFDDSNNYKKIIRFGNNSLVETVNGYISHIIQRNENSRLTSIYNKAIGIMDCASNESEFRNAAKVFDEIVGFKDSDNLKELCIEQANACNEKEEREREEQQRKVEQFEAMAKAKDARIRLEYLQKQMIKEQNDYSELQILAQSFDSKKLVIQRIEEDCRRIIEDIKQRQEKRSSLGIFSGKEKRKIDEDIKILTAEKEKAEETKINCESELKGFSAKQEVEALVQQKINIINRLKKQIDEASKASDTEISFSDFDFFKEYWTNETIRSIIDIKFANLAESYNNIELGNYYKSSEYKREPIEWIVLKEKDNKILLISKYALDCKCYNSEAKDITWETCSLRKWLNETFLNDAFSSEEQNKIAETIVTADKNPMFNTNPGNSTNDKVFLLSIMEVDKYFSSNKKRECQGTAYCYKKGTYKDSNGNCWWWLRSPGDESRHTTGVNSGGGVDKTGRRVNSVKCAVRPAIWLKI